MRLNTIGRPHLVRDSGAEIPLQPLPIAVLVYLAIGGPRNRDHLANLFWHGNKNGLNSLSTTLNRIRAEAPASLWVQGNALVGSDLATDVDLLRSAIDRSDFGAITELYGAPFLGSLKLRRKSEEFEEWLLEQRATLASMLELSLLQRGRDLHDTGNHNAAAVVAEQAWHIAIRDGFPSPDYFEAYHRILASAASPVTNAVRSMAEEFGISLSPVEPLAFDPGSSLVPTTRREPETRAPSLQLFGCEEELAAIASSVASQMLTTIVGLGGSGKTRLATEFFDSSEVKRNFPHRYWVDLRDVADHTLVAPTIASALGQRFEDMTSLADQLPDDESVLIVLDNFEQVLDAAETAEILSSVNPAIRLVVTSRLPLALPGEALVQLTGLEISDDEVDSPAEQLFESAARRSGVSDARLSSLNRAAVREVCRRVGGNPLALEIAAGWVQLLSATEILEALTLNNDLLGSPMVGELRTMETVLHQAWSTLSETEKNTLMLLATFPSGCLTNEALKIPELPIRSIGRLVQHSLVRLHIEGRITLHPLIASHALAELERRPDLKRKHQTVLSDWCQRFSSAMQANQTSADSQAYADEIANFASAWSWDADQRSWELHSATVGALRRFFTDSGRLSEGIALFGATASSIRSDPSAPEQLLAALLEGLGGFRTSAGDLSQAQELLAEALALCPLDDRRGRAQILRSLGALHLSTGEVDQAAANLQAGLAVVADVDKASSLTASLQFDLAQTYHYRGDQDQAEVTARLALKAGRAADDQSIVTVSYLLLAAIAVEADPDRAIVLLGEGLVIAKAASLHKYAPYFPFFSGLAQLKLNRANAAESDFADGIQAARDVGQLAMVCANSVGRGEARLLRKATADAISDLKAGIRLALKTSNGRYLMWAAVVSCRAAAATHAPDASTRELLLLVLRHPRADPDAQTKAIEILHEFFDETVRADHEPDREEAAASLDEVAERSLQLLAKS